MGLMSRRSSFVSPKGDNNISSFVVLTILQTKLPDQSKPSFVYFFIRCTFCPESFFVYSQYILSLSTQSNVYKLVQANTFYQT